MQIFGTASQARRVAGAIVMAASAMAIAPSTVDAQTSATYVSDRAWASATNGWGPVEIDRSNGEAVAGDGRTLTLNGTTHAKGLGTHVASDIRYALGGTCSQFTAVVGIDDEVGANGSVTFQVWT